MQKLLVCLVSACMILSACGDDSESKKNVVNSETNASENIESAANMKNQSSEEAKWVKIAGNPKLFKAEYKKFTPAQQYYFCTAFSLGAMSASKPTTASAMVSYFLGLGVEKYSTGINDMTYYAFDMGKNVFRYELVVNYILEEKICEKIITDATDYAKEKKISTDDINEKGKYEAQKIVNYIKKDKK